MRGGLAVCAGLALLGCQESHAVTEPAPPVASAAAQPAPASASASASTPARRTEAPKPDGERYPWLGDKGVPEPVDTLAARFEPPAGFSRVPLSPEGFGAWLRDLPLTHADAPVRTYSGAVLLAATDPRIAAVIAIDIGTADLQQCADAMIRLHAEWSWSRGNRNVSYRAAAGLALPFERWARGERIRSSGASIAWEPGGHPVADHAGYRKYLDAVFAWANTVSLHQQARTVAAADVRPGDFFVLPGNPGHTVIVLDMATRGDAKVALLGQSYMPAQSFQVLRPKPGGLWFELDAGRDVATPFWRPFPWTSLRRLD